MRQFAAMFKARSMEFLRDRGTLIWNLLLPFLLIFGFAFAFPGSSQQLFKVGLIGTPHQSLGFMHIKQIQFIKYGPSHRRETKAEVLNKLRDHQINMVIDFKTNTYYVNSQSAKGSLLKRLLRADAHTKGDPPLQERHVSGRRVTYVDWFVPGVIGLNMLFASLFGVGYVIVRYRKNGVLKRLKATPVSALNFVTAQAASRFVIVLATSIVVYVGANIFLHFLMLGSYLNLLLLTALGIVSMISLGLVFAARMRSEELANGLMNLVLFPMMVFSGVFFSLAGTPKLLQRIAQIFPLTHFINGARAIMLDGAGFTQVLPDYLFLAGFSVLFLLVASITFKWE